MPTETMAAEVDAEALRLQRMESSIEELNARIARLTIALGMSLKNENEFAGVINQLRVQAALHSFHSTSDRRLVSQWTELRCLLVLLYGVEQRFINQAGITTEVVPQI